jgi:hypothetical protein
MIGFTVESSIGGQQVYVCMLGRVSDGWRKPPVVIRRPTSSMKSEDEM